MEINSEIWRSINSYTKYEVSNIGRVRNAYTGRILKLNTVREGYYQTSLFKDLKKINYYVHRLVAQQFISNPENKQFVDHINHDKKDNNVSNLRWVDKSQNGMNRMKHNTNMSSIYKGVDWNKHRNKWRARIKTIDGSIHLGYFNDEKAAAKKYNEAAIHNFGVYALINEIEENNLSSI